MMTFQTGDIVRVMREKHIGKEGVITKIFFRRNKEKKRTTTHACVRFDDMRKSAQGPKICIGYLEMIQMREYGKHHRIQAIRTGK